MSTSDVDEVMRRNGWDGRRRVRLSDVGDQLGITPKVRSGLVQEGLVRPVPGLKGPGGAYYLDEDEARRLVSAVLITLATGIALAYVLRVLGAAGGG